jgi:hypothetical protein
MTERAVESVFVFMYPVQGLSLIQPKEHAIGISVNGAENSKFSFLALYLSEIAG